MNDDELLRYSRQIMLPDFDVAGQEHLAEATALIIGLGGLGLGLIESRTLSFTGPHKGIPLQASVRKSQQKPFGSLFDRSRCHALVSRSMSRMPSWI